MGPISHLLLLPPVIDLFCFDPPREFLDSSDASIYSARICITGAPVDSSCLGSLADTRIALLLP